MSVQVEPEIVEQPTRDLTSDPKFREMVEVSRAAIFIQMLHDSIERMCLELDLDPNAEYELSNVEDIHRETTSSDDGFRRYHHDAAPGIIAIPRQSRRAERKRQRIARKRNRR